MGKSQRLRVRDVRGVFRLIGECRELGDDANEWQRHLLTELCRLTGSEVGMRSETGRITRGERVAGIRIVMDVGWASAAAADHWRSSVQTDAHWRDPVLRRYFLDRRLSGVWSMLQLASPAVWQHSRTVREVLLPCGIGDILSSILLSPGSGNLNWLLLTRSLDGRPFDRRECRLLGLFHRELNPLIGSALAGPDDPCPSELPPRLRQTLDCLLDGDSEKQAALRIGISRPTMHQYVTALYRHFGVASRAELLAAFLRRFRSRRS